MQRLILCGGGHVSLEVAFMAQRLEFEIIVIDDREEFANRVRFPMVADVLARPFLEALAQVGGGPEDYFVILTRGHAFDKVCLAHILGGEYAYVGMIGSRTKAAAVLGQLEEEGFSRQALSSVHTPVGLDIGAQTPGEIALSILAEIVQERAKRGPCPPPPPTRPGVLCTIVKKSGSAPRAAGTWMLVGPDGACTGTIGGGAVERQVQLQALELWRRGGVELEQAYDLSQSAAQLGMVCGGSVTVRFERRP